MYKGQFIPFVLVVVIGLSLLAPFSFLNAQTSVPFGGLVVATVPCTCSPVPGTLWINFFPLYLGSSVPITGPLVYVPFVSTLYAWFMIGVPGTWHLGAYTPGAQACMVGVPPSCAPLPAAGVIRQVGTSRLF